MNQSFREWLAELWRQNCDQLFERMGLFTENNLTNKD